MEGSLNIGTRTGTLRPLLGINIGPLSSVNDADDSIVGTHASVSDLTIPANSIQLIELTPRIDNFTALAIVGGSRSQQTLAVELAIPVLDHADVRDLTGITLYVGYGFDSQDMLDRRLYRQVHQF